jgi:hypothetical protein
MNRFLLSILLLVKFSNLMPIEEDSFFVSNEESLDKALVIPVTSSSMQSIVLTNQQETNSRSPGQKLEEQRPLKFGPLEFLLVCFGVFLLILLTCYKSRKLIQRHCSKRKARLNENVYQQQIQLMPRTSTKYFNQNLSQQNYDYIEVIGF